MRSKLLSQCLVIWLEGVLVVDSSVFIFKLCNPFILKSYSGMGGFERIIIWCLCIYTNHLRSDPLIISFSIDVNDIYPEVSSLKDPELQSAQLAARARFLPDYTVRAVTNIEYLRITAEHYLLARRLTVWVTKLHPQGKLIGLYGCRGRVLPIEVAPYFMGLKC